MIDWEEVIRAEDGDKLREVKLWLFQENIRLENERRELEQSQEKFLNERVRLRTDSFGAQAAKGGESVF